MRRYKKRPNAPARAQHCNNRQRARSLPKPLWQLVGLATPRAAEERGEKDVDGSARRQSSQSEFDVRRAGRRRPIVDFLLTSNVMIPTYFNPPDVQIRSPHRFASNPTIPITKRERTR